MKPKIWGSVVIVKCLHVEMLCFFFFSLCYTSVGGNNSAEKNMCLVTYHNLLNY